MTNSNTTRLGWVCGLAALLAAGVVQAQEGVAMKNILGNMGIIPKDKEAIRYRERAPLVVPPKAELRAPASPESYASSNPQWPNDPDVASRRRSVEEASRPVTESGTRRMSDNNARLSPQELQAGRVARSEGPNYASHRGDNPRDVLLMSPDQLRAGRKVDDDAGPEAAPTRRALTEPPTALRRSATGKKLPNDFTPVTDTQREDANPITWLTRKFSGGDDE